MKCIENKFSLVQSEQDTPCLVTGEPAGRIQTPLLSLKKWNNEAWLLFKTGLINEKVRNTEWKHQEFILTTNKRKHIYRKLDSGRFEYDIVLPEEPDSPIITLPLEIPKGLNFYKQGIRYPHLMTEEVRGSYAVYWKERNNKFKTGKFCHIMRPRIFDSSGRTIWGDLEFDGENLHIIIPEQWIKRARYPVIIDPIIGTDTVGASHMNTEDPDPENWTDFFYEELLPVNRYRADSLITGTCTAYFYCTIQDSEAGGVPVIYSHNNSTGKPYQRKTNLQTFIDMQSPNATGSWLHDDFILNTPIQENEYFWFGIRPTYIIFPYFDEGGIFETMEVPYGTELPEIFTCSIYVDPVMTISMYIEYEDAPSYDYYRTLYNQASLNDSIIKKRDISRPVSNIISLYDSGNRKLFAGRTLLDQQNITEDLIVRTGFPEIFLEGQI